VGRSFIAQGNSRFLILRPAHRDKTLPSILIDDRASEILKLCSELSFVDFKNKWGGLATSQGIELDANGPLCDPVAFNALRVISATIFSTLLSFDFKRFVDESHNSLKNYGLQVPETIQITMCIGGKFNAKVGDRDIFLSLDKIASSEIHPLLLHELTHLSTPAACLEFVPSNLDRHLILEALAIKVTADHFTLPLDKLLYLQTQNISQWQLSSHSLLEKYREARIAEQRKHDKFHSTVFTGIPFDHGDARYGYFIAYLLFRTHTTSDLSTLLNNPELLRSYLYQFLGIDS
jgi:hypothetical protein